MPRYSWNNAKVDIKHQSINQSFNVSCMYLQRVDKNLEVENKINDFYCIIFCILLLLISCFSTDGGQN